MTNRAWVIGLGGLLAVASLVAAAPASALPQPAQMEVEVKGLHHDQVKAADRVRIVGELTPYAAGQEVKVILFRDTGKGDPKKPFTATLPVQQSANDPNEGVVDVQTHRIVEPGKYFAFVRHEPSPELQEAEAESERFGVDYPSLGSRDKGPEVKMFNKLLDQQGYVPSNGKRYTNRTGRAVLAFRKVNRMRRIRHASPKIYRELGDDDGAFKLRHPGAGKHVEVSIGRQVMALAEGGEAVRTYHVSTGTSRTPTIRGKYRFYRRQPGYNNVGMYYSVYFRGGYAIHGYKSVPTHRASHGCVRNPIPDSRSIYNWVRIGMRIYTY